MRVAITHAADQYFLKLINLFIEFSLCYHCVCI